MRPGLLLRLIAKIRGGMLVWLLDHDGEITCSIAYASPFGGLVTKRWWPYNISIAKLCPDGSVEYPSYVRKWVACP